MNIQERIEALETEFNEKIKELKAEAQQEQEFPQNGDEYWFIDEEGSVGSTLYDNHYIDDYYIDRCHQTIGNIFSTKEQAEFAVEKLKVEAELRKYSRPFDIEGDNWFVSYSENETIFAKSKEPKTQGVIYFESFLQLDKAVKTVGEERIKKYIFGVEVWK